MRLPALTEFTPRQQEISDKIAAKRGATRGPFLAAALHARTQILRDHFVDQETFDAALAEWGEAGLVDIIGCLGNFSMLAMLLNTFQVDLKPGDQPPFPDVRDFAKVSDPRG
jgi:hypothetical protein